MAAAILRAALRRSRPAAAALLHHRPLPSSRSLPPLPSLGSAGFGYSTVADESTAPVKPKGKARKNPMKQSRFDFTKVDAALLPTVILVGRPNVGKSALFNRVHCLPLSCSLEMFASDLEVLIIETRFIRRREALVYNTPGDHVTRDIREGVAKLGDLRFRVLDSAGLETAATSGSILARTADMTGNVLARSQFAIFLIDVRDGLQPLDLEVGQWLRRHASGIHTIVAMNKSESLDEHGVLTAAAGEAHRLGFGDPVAISAETGLGMAELYETLRPLFEDYMFQLTNNGLNQDDPTSEAETEAHEGDESKLPLQLAIVGRPNVGKSTLLNTLLQEQRVLVGPEAGLTRDSIRTQFQFDNRTVYLVDTAGWMERSGKEKGPASLSVVQSRKNLMRAHIVALVLDGEKIAKSKSSMNHPEVLIARQAIEEGRGLVVIVNKMDLLRENRPLFDKVIDAVPKEIQTVIPQVTGIPVVFMSALEGRGRIAVMRQVIDTYEKWCLRLSTSRLNRWLRKVMSRHSWKDSATQPKVKYFTQVKARPPTFVAFMSGKVQLSDTDIRFLTKSLKEDFDIGGIPIRVVQRSIPRKETVKSNSRNTGPRINTRMRTDKRTTKGKQSNRDVVILISPENREKVHPLLRLSKPEGNGCGSVFDKAQWMEYDIELICQDEIMFCIVQRIDKRCSEFRPIRSFT
uniref:GTPase Der n=1 Tax=Oryza glumipatula TaxID=40148 RepID=A0A0D9Y5G5_9ORYZ